ncbi:MAG TPA: DUF1707 domain-containing protein [Gemmatimonadaceae bacterium]|nr:DUF1707 domain-containing protein [Gemmatimonadaceae bacterium]
MTPQLPAAERERIVARLGEAFARDHLSLEEYERRVADAYRAPDRESLIALTHDLPESFPAPVSTAPAVSTAVTPRRKVIAFMSGVVRRGAWLVPARMRAVAVMGGVELDLREATLGAHETDIYAVAFMGGIVVTVPPTARVEADGFAIMGGFEDQLEHPGSTDPAAPVVRVRGFALMGGVEIRVAEVGEDPDRPRR